MSFKSLLAAGLAAVAFLGSPVAGWAQDKPSEQPSAGAAPAASADPKANWAKECTTAPDGRACLLRQTILTANGQFLGTLMVRMVDGNATKPTLIAMVPLGVLIAPRVTLKVDDGAAYPIQYAQCTPDGCFATLVIGQEYIDTLKKGKVMTMTVRNLKNEEIVIPINLAGFTAALESDVLAGPPAGNLNQLQQSLTERAEKERQERLNSGDSSAEPSSSEPSSAQ